MQVEWYVNFFLVRWSELYFLSQIITIIDVEKIMDETKEGTKCQRVRDTD